jgi:tryptophan-rich sensory protein
MGYSLYRIWQQPVSIHRRKAIILFTVQLVLNFFWSLIFFRWHQMGFATIEIIILWITLLLMIKALSKLDPVAGYLQIPYLLWVTFASLLCGSLWYLNT